MVSESAPDHPEVDSRQVESDSAATSKASAWISKPGVVGAAAVLSLLLFLLVTQLNALMAEMHGAGREPVTAIELTDLSDQNGQEWLDAELAWAAWQLETCPQLVVNGSCPRAEVASGHETARNFFLWDYALLTAYGFFFAAFGRMARGRWSGSPAPTFDAWLRRGAALKWFPAMGIIAALVDAVENTLALHVLRSVNCSTPAQCSFSDETLNLGLLRVATLFKWGLAGACLLFVAAYALGVMLGGLKARAARIALPYAVTVVLLLGLLNNEQALDVIRGLNRASMISTILSWVIFLVVLGSVTVRALRPRTEPTRIKPDSGLSALLWLIPAAVLVAMGLTTHSPGLYVGATLAALIAVVSAPFEAFTPSTMIAEEAADNTADEARTLDEGPVGDLHRIVPGHRLVLGIVLGLGLITLPVAVVQGLTADIFFTAHEGSWQEVTSANVVMLFTVSVIATVGAFVMPTGLDRLTARATRGAVQRSVWLLAAYVVALLIIVAFFIDPDTPIAAAVGGAAVILLFVTVLLALGGALREVSLWMAPPGRMVRAWRFPAAFRFLHLRSPALTGTLVVWLVLTAFLRAPEYNNVRWEERADLTAGADSDPDPPTGLTVQDAFEQWHARNTDDRATQQGTQPMLVVSSSGGGIRAAYWTAAVLTCLIEHDSAPIDLPASRDDSNPPIDACGDEADSAVAQQRADRIFLMSGISGGSVGLAEYDAHRDLLESADVETATNPGQDDPGTDSTWYDDTLGDDLLSPVLARWLFGDVPNALLRRDHGIDRARALEREIEESWVGGDQMSEGFLAGQLDGEGPVLLFNSFSLEDGCRLNVSVLRTNGGRPIDGCSALYGFETPVLDATTDILQFSDCRTDNDMSRSTAALLSARFPFVSPGGRLACGDNVTYAGDGGYRDSSAASPIVELWPEVAELIGDNNLEATSPTPSSAGDPEASPACVVPYFLQIDNGYSGAPTTSGDPRPSQLTAPLSGQRKASGAIANAARQAASRFFSTEAIDPAGTMIDLAPNALGDASLHRFEQITTVSHPGTKAPLGWVLSEAAQQDLDDQLVGVGVQIERVRAWLDGGADPLPFGRGLLDSGLRPFPRDADPLPVRCVRP